MEETKKNFENNLDEKFMFSKEFNLNNYKKNPFESTKTETKPRPTREKVVLTDDNDLEVGLQWMEIARRINRDLLPAFIDHLMDGYVHTYNSSVYACTACAIATAYACGRDNLSAFQGGAISVMFPLYYWYYDNKTSIMIVNYDDMLYPQFKYKYDKTISKSTWTKLQKAASDLMARANKEWVRDEVLDHWQSIVDGKVPFGYTVKEDD